MGFFFGAVTSLLKSSGMTREAKARMSETVEQMKRDYGAILADSGGKVTLDALSDLSAKSAQVRGILGSTQLMGQQATVKGVLQFLDALDDAVAQARAGMQGLVPGRGSAAPGLPPSLPIPGGAGTRGMPMLPGSSEVRDDWEVAIEEAVAEWNGVNTGRPKESGKVDISGESGIVFDREQLLRSGNQLDKGGELTKAGRALEKHGSRYGSIYPQATGNVANKNALGNQILESILSNPSAILVTRHHAMYGDILEIRIPGGMGVRFSADGNFIGFLE